MRLDFGSGEDGDVVIYADTDFGSANEKHFTSLRIKGPSYRPGVFGSALEFHNEGDYVDIGDVHNFDGNKPFTISFWVKDGLGVDDPSARVISKEVFATRGGWNVNIDSNRKVHFERIANNVIDGAVTTSQVSTNDFDHICCVYTGSLMKIYVNGVMEQVRASSLAIPVISATVRIGSASAGGGGFGNFTVDDLRIYNEAKTDEEVEFLASKIDVTKGLVSHYKFDKNTNDSIGGFHGTLVGQDSVILTANSPFRIFVKGALYVDGVLTANAFTQGTFAGSAPASTPMCDGGKGGDSGGYLIIQAKSVICPGKIDASGKDGGKGLDGLNPDTYGTANSYAGSHSPNASGVSIEGRTVQTGAYGCDFNSGNGGDGGKGYGINVWKSEARNSIARSFVSIPLASNGAGAGGHTGGYVKTGYSDLILNHGKGGGGGGCVRDGGDFGDDNGSVSKDGPIAYGGSGGSGGAGGVVILVSMFIYDLKVYANGGDGGNGGVDYNFTLGGGGGAGGSGGFVSLVIPDYLRPTVIDVSGGVKGQSGGSATSGGNGGDGDYLSLRLDV